MIQQFPFWVSAQKNWKQGLGYMYVHRGSIIHNSRRRKQPKGPSTRKWIKKMWSIHGTRQHSALKRKEILAHASVCTRLEGTLLSETSQSPKDSCVAVCSCGVPRTGSSWRWESAVCHSLGGGGRWELLLDGFRALERDGGDGCPCDILSLLP